MKYFIIYIMMVLPLFAQAKLWTLDNSPGAGADFTSFPTACSTADNGDSIVVMPSYTAYAGATISKKLFIYSRGHTNNSLDKDKRARIGYCSLQHDSIVMQGLYSDGVHIYNNNVIFSNNFVAGTVTISGNNNVIQGNVINAYNNVVNFYSYYNNPQNNLIVNNYIYSTINSGTYSGNSYSFIYGGNSSNLVANNFIAEMVSGSGVIQDRGFCFFKDSYVKIYNNILWSNVPNRRAFDTLNLGSVFKNNLTYSVNNNPGKLPGNNNYDDTMPQFEGGYDANNLPFYRSNNNLRLKKSTIGKNGGTDSTEVGLYGQDFNFSMEGNVPGVAIFEDFEVLNPVLKKGDVLKIKIKARKPKD